MPGTITHILVAKKIISKLPIGTIKNKALFFAGSIAPDAIHNKKEYIREDKKKTHMRLGIRDSEFHFPQNLKLFRKRVKNFIDDYIKNGDENIDLYKGYVVHLLTDEIFLLTVRREYILMMNKLGKYGDDDKFFESMTKELNENDQILAQREDDIENIANILEFLKPYEIRCYLTEKQLSDSRDWVIKNKLRCERKYSEPKYVTVERIEKFIEDGTNEIIDRLFKGEEFKKPFAE